MPAPTRRQLRLPVPCTVLTGALASGKTTAIASLLQSKPAGEVWAVLINEFGAAGLDAALLEGGAALSAASGKQPVEQASGSTAAAAAAGGGGDSGGVHIKQLAGGCLCCALSSVTAVAIAQLLRSVKPDRLLIEPSGLAHPAQLLDMLQGGHLASSLALQPVVCLVDATQFNGGATQPACCHTELLRDQIDVADVVVGSKADMCDELALHAFHQWARQLFPPKHHITTAAHGRVDPTAAGALLSWPFSGGTRGSEQSSAPGPAVQQQQQEQEQQQQSLPVQRVRRSTAGSLPWLSSSGSSAADGAAGAGEGEEAVDSVMRKEVADTSGAHAACGWIFPREGMFSRQHLQQLLAALEPWVLRLKGVFRISQKTWVAVSAGPGVLSQGMGLASQPAAAGGAGEAAGQSSAAADVAAAAPATAAAAELRETAYRRDSRVEVIINTAAAEVAAAQLGPAAQVAAAEPHQEAVDGSSLAQRAAELTLADTAAGNRLEQLVPAALVQAAAGDWSAMESLICAALQSSSPN